MALNFKQFKQNDRIILQLINNDVFEGEFLTSSPSWVQLNNCMDLNNSITIIGPQKFYISEIYELKSFGTPAEASNNSDSENGTASSNDSIMKISEKHYQTLNKTLEQYLYIPMQDVTYHEAIDYMQNCETLGVAMLGNGCGREMRLSLLVMCTWDQIYIFDFGLYPCKKMSKALAAIFESEEIVKVIHDSRHVVDFMHHKCAIEVRNIFDTFVAAKMLTGDELLLHQCLERYFHMPVSLVKEATIPAKLAIWDARPVEDEVRRMAGRNVQYLIMLKTHLQQKLLRTFHGNVFKHSRSTLEKDPFEAQLDIGRLRIDNQ